MGMSQTNTKKGLLTFLAAVDLISAEGLLAKITNDGGVAKATLPGAQNDLALYVIAGGAAVGFPVPLLPIHAEQQIRVKLSGACNPGDQLVLDVSSAPKYGMVKTLPATAGQYLVLGTAEEVGVDGQLVLVRANPRMVQVASAVIAAAGAPGATYSQSEAGDTQTKFNALLAACKAAGIVASA